MFVPYATHVESSPPCIRPLALPGSDRRGSASRTENVVLVREAQRGNSTAFEELVRRYQKALLGLALRLTGSEHDAQDVCQDAFLSAFQNLARFRLECDFHTWIYRIATNRCLDYCRKRENRRENSSFTIFPDGERTEVLDRVADNRRAHNPETNLAARELGIRIAQALKKLSRRERAVFVMKHYQGLKLRAAAVVLETNENNARQALYRATLKLRSALAELRPKGVENRS
jgi:RNA polymerase sigma-70 factor (ECF subfamily)